MFYGVFGDALVDLIFPDGTACFSFTVHWRVYHCSWRIFFRLKMKSWWTSFKRSSRYWTRCVSELLFNACSKAVRWIPFRFLRTQELKLNVFSQESASLMTVIKVEPKWVKRQTQGSQRTQWTMLNFKQNVQLCNRENLAIAKEMMRELSRVLLVLHLIGGEGTLYSVLQA